MAFAAKTTKSPLSTTTRRKPGRPPNVATGASVKAVKPKAAQRLPANAASIETRKPGRPAKAATTVIRKSTMGRTPAARELAVRKVSKGELRSQVERLEKLVAALRARSRETNKAAKAAAARNDELEAQVAQLEKAAAAAPDRLKPANLSRAKRQGREVDPGDAVPSKSAVQDSASLDDGAEESFM